MTEQIDLDDGVLDHLLHGTHRMSDDQRHVMIAWATWQRAMADVAGLIVIARAALAAGPWPHTDRVDSDDVCEWCRHTSHDGDIQHAPDCRGVRMRDALAAIKEAGK